MHELALADAVITSALETAREHGIDRIDRIVVLVGELQNIKRDVFEFALRDVMPANEPAVAAAEIALDVERARFRCRPCGFDFGLDDTEGPGDADEQEAIHFIPELAHAYLRCPRCQSPDFEVLSGRGVVIQTIEGDGA